MSAIDRVDKIFNDADDERGKPQGQNPWSLQFMMIALLLVTGYFSWDYLWGMMRDKQLGMIVAAAGLAAFDLGALLWSRVWKANASNESQDTIARNMFIVDVIGMLLTTLGDSVPRELLPKILSDATPIIIGVVIVLNVVAKLEYDHQADSVRRARAWRKRQAQIARTEMEAELELEMQRKALEARHKALEQQELLAAQEQALAQAELRLQATRQGTARARVTGEHIEMGKRAVQSSVVSGFQKWAHEVAGKFRGGNGHYAMSVGDGEDKDEPGDESPNA